MARKQIPSIQRLNRLLVRMNRLVLTAVEQAVQSLAEQDQQLARQVVDADDAIDRAEVSIERNCIELLTAGPLSAEQLRYVLCLIKINNDLERVADCATDIAERLPGFVAREAPMLPHELRIMANSALGMLRDAVNAWLAQDAAAAREVMRADDIVDALYDQLARDLRQSLSEPTEFRMHFLDYLLAARDFERIADHATNIAECTIHSATGRIVRHARQQVDEA